MGGPKNQGGGKPKQSGSVLGDCLESDCKSKDSKFGFCSEHYEQFKFGLINKKGIRVPDYDKKFEHYQAYIDKKNFQKVA